MRRISLSELEFHKQNSGAPEMQRLKNEIKKKIITTSIDEFLKNGFIAASLRDIAKAVGISTGNLYTYFPGKEQLFYTITEDVKRELDLIGNYAVNRIFWGIFDSDEKMLQYIELISEIHFDLMKKYGRQLIIILECSKGTKLENFKKNLIGKTEKSYLHILKGRGVLRDENIKKYKYLMHIISTNYIDGLVKITRNYKSYKMLRRDLNLFNEYHIKGLVTFFRHIPLSMENKLS
jgi:hypothetical protein